MLATSSVSNTELVCYLLDALNTCINDVICFLKLVYEMCYLKLFDAILLKMMIMNLKCTCLMNDLSVRILSFASEPEMK